MKVSEWLREYQLTGQIPEGHGNDPLVPFWAGWLMGRQRYLPAGSCVTIAAAPEKYLQNAIDAAEFIESRAKE